MVLNSMAKVQHIFAEDHLTGSLYTLFLKDKMSEETKTGRKADLSVLRERQLFFFRLYGKGNGLSLVSKLCSVLNDTLLSLKSFRNPHEFDNLRVLYVSNITGLRWLMSELSGTERMCVL
jgi:hypothetical protein